MLLRAKTLMIVAPKVYREWGRRQVVVREWIRFQREPCPLVRDKDVAPMLSNVSYYYSYEEDIFFPPKILNILWCMESFG
jgi:hypothetical protein